MSRMLPDPAGGPLLSTVGYFNHPASGLADWMAAGNRGTVSRPGWATIHDVSRALPRNVPLTQRAFVPVGGWTLLLTDGPLGTDTGVLPIRVARDFGCTSLRAVWAEAEGVYPAVILEVGNADGGDSNHRRYIAAAKDGGRWIFEEGGAPYDFEETHSYSSRRKRDRFTGPMLHRYLLALGVPIDIEPDWGSTVLVTEASPSRRE